MNAIKDTRQIYRKGEKVTYCPSHSKQEHGIVKRMSEDGEAAFVVYHWGENFSEYENYTAARTNLRDLKAGWL